MAMWCCFGIAANVGGAGQRASCAETRCAGRPRLLYRQGWSEMFPQSHYAGEAAWRSADIRWQLQKEDAFSRPSAHEKESYLRQQLDEDELKKVLKLYPGTQVGRSCCVRHPRQ